MAFTPEEKLDRYDFLKNNGFTFEKRGTLCIGTTILDKDAFGSTVIGIDLDADRNPWFVAPSHEASRVTVTAVHDIENPNMKLAAAAFVGRIKRELKKLSGAGNEVNPESPKEQATKEQEQKSPRPTSSSPPLPLAKDPDLNDPPKGGSGVPASNPADLELPVQIIKNVTQCGVKVTRNTKGYNWEISVHEDDIGLAIDKAIAANDKLQKLLGAV